MLPAGPVFHKPKSIIAAKNLLYTSIFVAFLAVLVRDFNLTITGNGGAPALILTVAGYVVIFFIIKQMTMCKKWARTTLLIIYTLITAWYLFFLFRPGTTVSMLEEALIAFQACLQIIAMVFLYTKESNHWFNSSTHGDILP